MTKMMEKERREKARGEGKGEKGMEKKKMLGK